jgi:hypothetical protein
MIARIRSSFSRMEVFLFFEDWIFVQFLFLVIGRFYLLYEGCADVYAMHLLLLPVRHGFPGPDCDYTRTFSHVLSFNKTSSIKRANIGLCCSAKRFQTRRLSLQRVCLILSLNY